MGVKKLTAYRAPGLEIVLGSGDKSANPNAGPTVPVKVQVLRIGKFSDPRYGNFEIKLSDLESMVQNFESKIRGVDIAVDYFHESDKIAAGWMQRLYIEENKLFADVKWTQSAYKCLAEGELRYVSADFMFEYTDNETGKKFGPTLLGAGLTNRPVIKEMNPIIELKEGESTMDLEKRCQELEEKLAELGAAMDKLKPAAGKGKDADDNDEGEGDDKDKELAAMKAKVAAYEANEKKAGEEKSMAEKKGKFDKMLSEGKAVEAQRDAFMKDNIAEYTAKAQVVKLSTTGHGGEGGGSGTDTAAKNPAQNEVLTLAEKLVADKKANDISDALSMVLAQNKDLNAKYQAEVTL